MQTRIELINWIYPKLSRRHKRWIFRIIDLFLFYISLHTAFSLRFDIFLALYKLAEFKELIIIIPIKLFFFTLVGVYRPILRYTGLELLGTVFLGVICSSALIGVAAVTGLIAAPRSVIILDALLTLTFVVTVRIFIRWFLYVAIIFPNRNQHMESVLIYGAGKAGAAIANALSNDNSFRIMGFIDDHPQFQNQVQSGYKVYSRNELEELIKKFKIDSILLALPSISYQSSFAFIKELKSYGVQVKTVPGVSEIISGKVAVNRIRRVDIADILGREEVSPDMDLMAKNITGQSVVVTGAGGSIGSELCLQIMQLDPKQLILVERNELALYSIEFELRNRHPKADITAVLGSVNNKKLLHKIFSQYAIDTVYHASAYKHVPLLEENPEAAIVNNVGGTLSCVEAAVNASVGTFVLISTDKAVRPRNIMGATKRISEQIIQAKSGEAGVQTEFAIVRFGNVLDSAGSVVPLFRKQIASGWDLTVTHSDITRFFMSIPEAVRLVIQAGAMVRNGGEVFLLDMGVPIKIYDLAVQMIELSGLELGKDINIVITGLRPGEKLHEELLIDTKTARPTPHPKIFFSEEASLTWDELYPLLISLLDTAKKGELKTMVKTLGALVPEYHPADNPSFQN